MRYKRRHGGISRRQTLCRGKVNSTVRNQLGIGDEIQRIDTAAGLCYLCTAIFRNIDAVFMTMMVMVTAAGLIVAMVVMNLLASVIGKYAKYLHSMVHRTFVKP